MASLVCGMTSSSATTRITMSVAWAPRARMAVKASCPGVSKEGHHAAWRFHVVCTDMLGNAAGFAGRHLGTTDVVQQRGLSVVHVAHHGHTGARGKASADCWDTSSSVKASGIVQRCHDMPCGPFPRPRSWPCPGPAVG